MRRAAHVANSPLRVPTPQADDSREEPGQRARTGEPVFVHAQSQIAVGARGIRREQPPVDVAHRFRVFGGAVGVPMLLTLARAIAQRGRQPEIHRPGRVARARERQPQQGIDALQREVGGIERRGPPNVGTRLEDQGRGISRLARGQSGEIRGGALEAPAIQRVEARAQCAASRIRALKHQYDRGEQLHVSGERRLPAAPAPVRPCA